MLVKPGMRKFSFGVLAEVLLFVIAMWGPDPTEQGVVRVTAIQAMLAVAGMVAGAMAAENVATRKPSSGSPQ